jgi:spore coat protein U-like protein
VTRRLWGVAVLAIAIPWLLPSRASAQSCSITAVSGVAFGSYDVFASAPVDATGSVTVQCLAGVSVQIQLNPGLHGTFAARAMQRGGNENLTYNLYTTAAHSTIWGDGTQGTGIVTITLTILNLSRTVQVFGQVGAQQNVSAGSYSDTVTVTIVF